MGTLETFFVSIYLLLQITILCNCVNQRINETYQIKENIYIITINNVLLYM